jgi:hypothetical protein
MEEETTGLAVGGGAPSDCEGGESRDGDSRDSEDEVRPSMEINSTRGSMSGADTVYLSTNPVQH